MFTSLRLGRILNPTAITESDPYWSCCLGNAPLRLILETPQKKKNNNIEFGAPHLINVYDHIFVEKWGKLMGVLVMCFDTHFMQSILKRR